MADIEANITAREANGDRFSGRRWRGGGRRCQGASCPPFPCDAVLPSKGGLGIQTQFDM